MSILGYYSLDGNITDYSYNNGFMINNNLTYSDFGKSKVLSSNLDLSFKPFYNINKNEFSISFLCFINNINSNGTQIIDSNILNLVVFPNKLSLYKGEEYSSNSSNCDLLECNCNILNKMTRITISYNNESVKLYINENLMNTIDINTNNNIIKYLKFKNIHYLSELYIFDNFISDRYVYELYKGLVFEYLFSDTINILSETTNNNINILPNNIFSHKLSFSKSLNKSDISNAGYYTNKSIKLQNTELLFPESIYIRDSAIYVLDLNINFIKIINSDLLKLDNSKLLIKNNKLYFNLDKIMNIELNKWYSILLVIKNNNISFFINNSFIKKININNTKIVKLLCNSSCNILLDRISFYHNYISSPSNDDILKIYDNTSIIDIDDIGNLYCKNIVINDDIDYVSFDNEHLSLNSPSIREVGRDIRYIKVICDGSEGTNTNSLNIIKIDVVLNGEIFKTLGSKYVSSNNNTLELVFDIGSIKNVECLNIYFNPLTSSTKYINKRIKVSSDNNNWSEDIYSKIKIDIEYNDIPTKYTLHETSVKILGDKKILSVNKIMGSI